MNITPWTFESYKAYLRAWISAQPHQGHGSKAAIARAAQCQTAYISQVVLGSAHLSLEQGERIANFLGLTEDEAHFFLLLLQKDRAGTESLKRYFAKQQQTLLKKRSQLKERVEKGTELSLDAQATYFSSWVYPAVQLLTRLTEFQKPETIARRLALPVVVVEEALSFLEGIGLLARKNGKWISGSARMHLPHDSPLVAKHHINWRLRAIRDLEIQKEESLHYSSVVTISKKDALALREMLLKAIESAKKMIKDSEDEMLYSFCLDLFEI